MAEPRIAAYGSWKSPITTELIVSKTIGLMEPSIVGEDLYWLEMRPQEQGRCVVINRSADGMVKETNSAPFNARTRVHEYGGASYRVDGHTVYFSNFADQRVYRQDRGAKPRPITPEGAYRYADATIDSHRGRLICVREDHSNPDLEPVNTLSSVPLTGSGKFRVLLEGADFYSSPRLSPDGQRLAWISWNHPNMPWDGSELWVALLDPDGTPGEPVRVAGASDESILQPEWSPDGDLYFISDRSGWWNLYRWRDARVVSVVDMCAEFGSPPWVFGDSSYAFESEARIICTYRLNGSSYLAEIDTKAGRLETIETPYTSISYVRCAAGRVVFLGASPTAFASLVELDLETRKLRVMRRTSDISIDPGYLSSGKAIEFPTEHGLTAHGFFYRPKNKDYVAPTDERAPLLVMSHGGPTSACDSALHLSVQFWTSRGIAVLDVNYGGSSGYGRAYRERLNGQWGVVDVDDCVNGARYLTDQDLVDGERLAIRGGSAGGYTTLSALAFRDVFKAGASRYGVSDLEALTRDIHKFESHYLDRLLGSYPECKDLYKERSPINAVDRFSCPVIFFQGLEDNVVPPNQAEKMVEALRLKGLPVAYMALEGEQHGFRRADTIKRVLDAELYFYSRIFGFGLSEPVEPVAIENL